MPAVNSSDAILRLHVKMVRTTRALKAWRRRTVGNIKVQLAIIQIVLTMLEKAQENRRLSRDELDFRRRLKIKILGLAGIQISNARQHFRQTWVRLGDANTKIFHLMANHRKRKKISDP
jgi:hypothetical protein